MRRKLVYCECINGGGGGDVGPMHDASVPGRLGLTGPEINDGRDEREHSTDEVEEGSALTDGGGPINIATK